MSSSENLKFCTFVPDVKKTINDNKFRAVFIKDVLWPNGSTISYSFLNKPSDVVPKGKVSDFF